MASRADRIISALRTGHDELVPLLDKLGPDDLTRTSGAADWTVAQVLSHLGSGAEINLATLEGALAGTGNPGRDLNTSVWARWDGMSPAKQAASFPPADEKLVRRPEGVDRRPRAGLPAPVGFPPPPGGAPPPARPRPAEFAPHARD